jgi:hypothetical protein
MFTQAMRTGDFSASPTLKNGAFNLDANSVNLLASEGKTNCILSPTKLNPACFDPVAVGIMNQYWPLPNAIVPGSFNNYVNSASNTTNENDSQYRVDHTIDARNQIMGRVNYEEVNNYIPDGVSWGGNPANTITYNAYTTGLNAAARVTTRITPHILNTFGWGQTYTKVLLNETAPMPTGLSIKQSFPGADPLNRIPDIQMSQGWAPNGVSGMPIKASDGEGIPTDDLSWVKGNHVVQVGALYIYGIKRQTAFATPEGVFSFTGTHTGDTAADYLLGLDATYSQVNTQRRGYFHYRQGEAYVQDDWRATHRLTLNMGLRWSYFSNDTASGDLVTGFSPASYSATQAPVVLLNGTLSTNSSNVPLNSAGQPANLLTGITYAGQNGTPSGFFIPKKSNFGPRVGFAYDLSGNGTTSIRGGYGLAYSRNALAQLNASYGQNEPYVQSVNIINSLISNGSAGSPKAPTTQALNVEPTSFTPVHLQTFSLTVEHQLTPSTITQVAYVGAIGRHLETTGFDTNYPLSVSAPSTSNCLPAGQAPSSSYDFDPCISAGSVSSAYTRPYQGYSAINTQYDGGMSNYNSLQAGVVHNRKGSQVSVAYTYSKALGTLGGTVQNYRNLAAEYGPPSYNSTHLLTSTWVYSIPLFKHDNKVLDWTLGNWSLAGLALLQSGSPLTPGLSTSTKGLAIRPNQVAPVKQIGSLQQWFSTTSFVAPPSGFYGNAHQGTIIGPHTINFNVGLYKTFPIEGRLNMQLRAEAFNVANHPNFNGVSTNVGSGSYGQVTSALNPRLFELAMKINF